MIAMFPRCIEYIVVKISIHFTPYLIESTLELLERTGVDLCTQPNNCAQILSCAVLLTAPIKVPMMRCCVELHSRYCALLYVIVRYRALLCTTLKIS